MDKEWKLIGSCGVDSGTIIFADPCYVMPDEKEDMKLWAKEHKNYSQLFDSMHKNDPRYDKVQASEEIVAGIGGNAVVMHTYMGDGNYPVYAKFDTYGKILEAKIVFWEEENEEIL